jgi:phosphoribosylformylglycinamidine synthase subunit PurSL
MRAELFYRPGYPDGRAAALSALLSRNLGISVETACVDVIITDYPIERDSFAQLFVDSIVQSFTLDAHFADSPEFQGWSLLIEISYRPGVTDTLALTAREALIHEFGRDAVEGRIVQTARQYLFKAKGTLEPDTAEKISGILHNPLIQHAELISRSEWEGGTRPPERYPIVHAAGKADCDTFPIGSYSDTELVQLSKDRLLALTLEEMKSLQGYFADAALARKAVGLPPEATDVEIEMVAQTWSEHCKHKLFNATIRYREGDKTETIASVFKTYIRATTEELAPSKPFLKSVFTDNSGVIAFDEDTCLCIKAETHNSPSALDPYGGAITGIVGVNRDILGTGIGAKPIFNTNVLCFGMPDTAEADIPAGLLHPREVLKGVHRGIVDGGNQSGIPTAAGGFLFDESYAGKPLVFCGTGGILPAMVNGEPCWEKKIEAGDAAIMLGGRIGKDGIHGATFSSLELSESSPVTAVQIGDPIIQKKMTDFLLEARDKGLYKGITDNGAGGLSSSLGEMAESSGGIRIDLDTCPLKYPGLAAWEILVSESQERMSLSVSADKLPEFLALAKKRDVEATVVGEFLASGYIDLRYRGKCVGLLSIDFLHRGLPKLDLPAVWIEPEKRMRNEPIDGLPAHRAALLSILSDPNVASKESLVRQYDHEVQAMSIEKPFVGAKMDAPSDGAVLKPRYDSWKGISVTHGICPRFGDWDTERMARCAVDEAFRAHVALGGDPGQAAALDNFCWPDPAPGPNNPDAAYKMAQLVRACRGLKDACVAYGLPLISGKDSMKNDSTLGGKRLSVRPTLLVTLMGILPDARKAISSDFKAVGDVIYILGDTNGEMGGSAYERAWLYSRKDKPKGSSAYAPTAFGQSPDVDLGKALSLYQAFFRAAGGRLVRSAHDLSEGGLAVALAESCLGGRTGARINLDSLPGQVGKADPKDGLACARLLFSESPARLLVSVKAEDRERFESSVRGRSFARLGEVVAEPLLTIGLNGTNLVSASIEEIRGAFQTPIA